MFCAFNKFAYTSRKDKKIFVTFRGFPDIVRIYFYANTQNKRNLYRFFGLCVLFGFIRRGMDDHELVFQKFKFFGRIPTHSNLNTIKNILT